MESLEIKLKKIIEREVFIKNKDEQIESKTDPDSWLFDFRRVLMRGDVSNMLSDIFYETYKERYPFQLCSLEIAGVPLMTSIMTKFFYKGHTDINAFFIRKSRKKSGLMRMIEGEILQEKKIILVDDIMNSGSSFWRQIEVLEKLGYKIDTVWSILRFRDLDYYDRFHNRGIKVDSLFTLDDFTESLGDQVKNIKLTLPVKPSMPFDARWVFKSSDPGYNYVVPKSQPVLDADCVYFGSDNRTFWSINQNDGSVKWKYVVGSNRGKKKSILSNPILINGLVIFGAYDGNIYALDKRTGKRIWTCFEADWVGSSPALAENLGLVFVGLEFGLVRKHGGVVALKADTGEIIWSDNSHYAFTHATPFYIEKYQQVVIGSNDGILRMYDAKTGKILWKFTSFGGETFDEQSDATYGNGSIKECVAYDSKHDYLIFGSEDGFLYIVNRHSGKLVHYFECEFGLYATPYIFSDRVYFTCLDKYIRCIDLNTLKLVFERNLDNTRIFAQPTVINGRLYVGTNAGRLHELNPETGETIGYFQANERITNSLLYNKETDTYFLPTYANEIICLKRTSK